MIEEKPKGFFPTQNLMSYSYSTSLATSESEEARELFGKVGTKAAIDSVRSRLMYNAKENNTDIKIAVENIKKTADQERAKEVAFLRGLFGSNNKFNSIFEDISKNPQQAREFIDVVNKLQPSGLFNQVIQHILQNSKIVERNGQIKVSGIHNRTALYNFFRDEVPKAFQAALDSLKNQGLFTENMNVDAVVNIAYQQIAQAFKNSIYAELKDSMPQTVAAEEYKDGLEKILQAIDTNNTLEGLLYGFDLTRQQLTKSFTNIKRLLEKGQKLDAIMKKENIFTIRATGQAASTSIEGITTASINYVLQGLHSFGNDTIKGTIGTAYHSGNLAKTSAKNDTMAIINLNIDFNDIAKAFEDYSNLQEEETAGRLGNIRAMRALSQQINGLNQNGYMLEVSDKYYDLSASSFSGFSPQTATSWNNIEQVLKELEANDNLIGIAKYMLANAGTGYIYANWLGALQNFFGAYFVSFVFDDIALNVSEGTSFAFSDKSVHIFNLSGIYMPLSIVLQGIYESLISINTSNLSSWVSTTISANSVALASNRFYDEADWNNTFANNLKGVSIKMEFMKNFREFMYNMYK